MARSKELKKPLVVRSKKGRQMRIKKPQVALLYAIMWKFGGPKNITTYLSKSLKESMGRQTFVNWVLRGKVPLSKVKDIAKTLGVPPYALNYTGIKEASLNRMPSWKKTVMTTPRLTAEDKRKILELGEP